MTIEQLLKDIQRLIDRGTLNSSAEIEIRGEATFNNDNYDFTTDVYFSNLKMGIAESHYNKLLLISEPDDV